MKNSQQLHLKQYASQGKSLAGGAHKFRETTTTGSYILLYCKDNKYFAASVCRRRYPFRPYLLLALATPTMHLPFDLRFLREKKCEAQSRRQFTCSTCVNLSVYVCRCLCVCVCLLVCVCIPLSVIVLHF